MSAEKIRQFNPDFVETAEIRRQLGLFAEAIEITTTALDFPGRAFADEEIAAICRDSQQLAVMACLVRIQVDSLKSMANHQVWPPKIIGPLHYATATINHLYRHPQFQQAIAEVTNDHLGRPHYFGPEMERDVIKTAQAAVVVYPYPLDDGSRLNVLENWAIKRMGMLVKQLPEDHPTKPLVAIEYGLTQYKRNPQIRDYLLHNLEQLVAASPENRHRIATAAAWVAIAAEGKQDTDLAKRASTIFYQATLDKLQLEGVIQTERAKTRKERLRKLLVRTLLPFTTTAAERDNLCDNILGTESN